MRVQSNCKHEDDIYGQRMPDILMSAVILVSLHTLGALDL